MQRQPALVIFSGLPGTGKTTLARGLTKRIGAVYLRIDTIEQALRDAGASNDDSPAGYLTGYAIARDNLDLGNTVVADSVNATHITRDAWRAVAEQSNALDIEIEVICSDQSVHRQRVESRSTDVVGLTKPNWHATITRTYDLWERSHIIIDTAKGDITRLLDALDTEINL